MRPRISFTPTSVLGLGPVPTGQITEENVFITNTGNTTLTNVVVSDAVIDGDNSIVLQQANNRVFAAQAVLRRMLLAAQH